MKKTNRIILWSSIAVLVIGSAFAMAKLANKPQAVENGSNLALTINAISDTENVKGNKEAKITLIEYSDFQCPACAAYYPLLKQISAEFGNDVRFAYRHFPLPQHKNAKIAGIAAEAAGKQGKFWEMHDMIFENQRDWAEEKDAAAIFANYAADLGLDLTKFSNDISSQEIKDKIDSDYKSGLKAKVNSTPSFFLNGKKINNPRNYDEMKALIQAELQ
ncbi:hypothetical protein C4572_00030 [Candidatus Parcubacteria bacterium]|nr:MAG: hypothetical protein C4572_00030 [Candidatus Parcubacteria bacterium]